MTNSDDFCVCILDKINPQFKEFQKLLAVERAKAFKDFETHLDKAVFLKSVYDIAASKTRSKEKRNSETDNDNQ
jgi:hypothetical protein